MRIGSASACALVAGLALAAGSGAFAQNETGEEGGRLSNIYRYWLSHYRNAYGFEGDRDGSQLVAMQELMLKDLRMYREQRAALAEQMKGADSESRRQQLKKRMAEIDRAMQQPQAKLAAIQQKIQWQSSFIRALVDGLRGDPNGLFSQQLGAFDAASERPNIARILTDMKETAAPCVWAALSEDLQTNETVREGGMAPGNRTKKEIRESAEWLEKVMMGMRRHGLPPVVDTLKHSPPAAQKKGLELLRKLGVEPTVWPPVLECMDAIVKLRKSRDAELKEEADKTVMALLRSRNWQTAWLPRLDPFIDLLDDSSADVREMAREFLTRMTSQEFGGESKKWREWYAPIREKYQKRENRDMVVGGRRDSRAQE